MTDAPETPRDLVTPGMIDALKATKPWVRFLAILGFVLAGLMVLASLAMGAFGIYQVTEERLEAWVLVGMAALYAVMGVVYIFPSRFLYRYASAIAEAADANVKAAAIERALREQKSFWKFAGILTLVMLLLYIPAILIAIALPNVLSATQRSKQVRSMADLRTIATAVEAYATDHNAYPSVRTIDELAPLLEPTYTKSLPRVDGWEKAFFYEPIQCAPACAGYRLASAGKNGTLERPLADYEEGFVATADDDADIVFGNGEFIRAPEGRSGSG